MIFIHDSMFIKEKINYKDVDTLYSLFSFDKNNKNKIRFNNLIMLHLTKINHKKASNLILDQANILDGNILSNPSAYLENLTEIFIK